jgi:DNA-binding transcriptional ArsR family regulator
VNQLIDLAADNLSLAFGALSDPTRRAILARLAASGEATVGQLASRCKKRPNGSNTIAHFGKPSWIASTNTSAN